MLRLALSIVIILWDKDFSFVYVCTLYTYVEFIFAGNDFGSRVRSNLMDADRPTRPGPEDPAAVDSCSWLLGRRQLGQSEATTLVTEGKHIKGVQLSSEPTK